jgi:hypothetical protein
MDEEKKKNDTSKILSRIQAGLQMLEFLAFVESVKRFKLINGREPNWGEKK